MCYVNLAFQLFNESPFWRFSLLLIILITSLLSLSFVSEFIKKMVYRYISKHQPKLRISIEGNIGSGKSTFLKLLTNHPHFQNRYYFATEPVDTWTSFTNDKGENLLSLFYKDQERWSYTFQNFAYISRLIQSKSMENIDRHIISERCVYTDKNVFAKMLHQDNKIDHLEMSIYNFWFNAFPHQIDLYIYLKTDVDNCQTRIRMRNRGGESNIPTEYLEKLEEAHDKWLVDSDKTLILNGNVNFVDNSREANQMVNTVNEFIQSAVNT